MAVAESGSTQSLGAWYFLYVTDSKGAQQDECTFNQVFVPLALVCAAVWEALQSPAPAMILAKVALIDTAILICSSADPAHMYHHALQS